MNEGSKSEQPALDLPLTSREALEQALNSRTQPTAEDATRIAELTGLDLRQAVYRATDAVSVFDDLLLQLQDDDFRLDEALQTVEANALTDEHEWRRVLETLAVADEDADELRAVALVKYRRYLRNRLEALENRQEELAAAAASATRVVSPPAPAAASAPAGDEPPEFDIDIDLDLELDLELDPGDGAAADAPEPENSAPLQLDALSEQASGAEGERPQKLLRLHRGRPVALSPGERTEVDLWLGRSKFRLLLGGVLRLLSESGRECGRLREGRNLIGRSPDCEIVIDPRHDTVSRVHLEVAVEQGRLGPVTDLSSGGTYVRPELVGRRTNAA